MFYRIRTEWQTGHDIAITDMISFTFFHAGEGSSPRASRLRGLSFTPNEDFK
jgi:hypothetical protein